METPEIPGQARLRARWFGERFLRSWGRAMFVLAVAALVGLLLLVVLPPSAATGWWTLAGIINTWLLAAAWLAWRVCRCPSTVQLAKRADQILGFPDALLHLASEHPSEAASWVREARAQTEKTLTSLDLEQLWPVRPGRREVASTALALVLTAVVLVLGFQRGALGAAAEAQLAAERAARAEMAEEMLADWEQFTLETEDPALWELFTRALDLREKMAEADLTEAMMLLHEAENSLQSLADRIAAESMAAHASAMAEAFESIQGMGALAAALRRGNFPSAAAEAKKLTEQLAAHPGGTSSVQRAPTVAEMLASTAEQAGAQGQESLREALQNLSACAASGQGKIANSDLERSTRSLSEALDREAQRQNQGRSLATGQAQLEALRQRLAGADNQGMPFPSLCQSGGPDPGGREAGTGSGGDPLGDPTALADPGIDESLTGRAGAGESETRTTRDSAGSAGAITTARAADLATFEELSRQAVADESLPLAHRQAIRAYFERIRPITQNP